MKNGTIAILALLMVVGGYLFWQNLRAADDDSNSGRHIVATVYKDPNCGCCENFVAYLRRKDVELEVVNTSDMESIKSKYNIKPELQSCHTTVIGDYFVEGHVPMEAIEKLLDERPAIAGISLPAMPSGSPGMPGTKFRPFSIYSIMPDGSSDAFLSL